MPAAPAIAGAAVAAATRALDGVQVGAAVGDVVMRAMGDASPRPFFIGVMDSADGGRVTEPERMEEAEHVTGDMAKAAAQPDCQFVAFPARSKTKRPRRRSWWPP